MFYLFFHLFFTNWAASWLLSHPNMALMAPPWMDGACSLIRDPVWGNLISYETARAQRLLSGGASSCSFKTLNCAFFIIIIFLKTIWRILQTGFYVIKFKKKDSYSLKMMPSSRNILSSFKHDAWRRRSSRGKRSARLLAGM